MKELAACDPARFGKYVTVVKGEKVVNMDALKDPKTGIEAGTAALKMYMDRYDGDAETALIAYNWGPGNVGKSEKDLTPAEMPGYNRAKAYVGNIQTVLGTTEGPGLSGTTSDQSENVADQPKVPKKAPLPKKSLLHYLPPEEVSKYQSARVNSRNK